MNISYPLFFCAMSLSLVSFDLRVTLTVIEKQDLVLMENYLYADTFPDPVSDTRSNIYVKDWGKQAMTVGEEIWQNAESEIISQIGSDEYAAVKKNYDYKNIPSSMSLISAENRKNVALFYEKMSKLKMYKIASFAVNSNGTNWSRNLILKVPYKGNEGWDKNVKWDIVYFIINEDAVETYKKTNG